MWEATPQVPGRCGCGQLRSERETISSMQASADKILQQLLLTVALNFRYTRFVNVLSLLVFCTYPFRLEHALAV